MKVVISIAVAAMFVVFGAVPASADRSHLDGYDLPSSGVLLEGIGYDKHEKRIYVSGVNDGGAIYWTSAGQEHFEVWQPGNTDGRTTARGIDVDDRGRVFIAGGPSAKLFIYRANGAFVAALDAPAGTVLNDVWVGSDGVYVTDSSTPRIFKVTRINGEWTLDLWVDASASIPAQLGPDQFNLNGIVETRDGEYLLVPQTNTGKLWRFDKSTKEVTEVDLGGASIPFSDGIALKGRTLYAIQNFEHKVSEIRLSRDYSEGWVKQVIDTPADRTFTTAKFVRGELLAVDSQFNQPEPWGADNRVVAVDR